MNDLQAVVYQDGIDFFHELESKYIRHSKGLFILTPSGAGKTYYCTKQNEQHWIDGDDLYFDTGAQPIGYEWWNKGPHIINRVEQRCDVITAEAVDRGYWIMGSINYWLKPDAIVLPTLDTLMRQIKQRQNTNYDGGLKSEQIEQLIVHLGIINDWYVKYNVPKFTSIQEAVSSLTVNS